MRLGHSRAVLLCCAVVFPQSVQAQSKVTIYGTLNVDVESARAVGSGAANGDFKSRTRVANNSSNLGVRGTEELGAGLAAWFQIENAAPIDEGGGSLASRNSAVGLRGAFGQILLGQWDTPYKVATGRLDPFGNTGIAAYTGIMGFSGSLTAGQGGANFQQRASFDRRTRNVVQYWSPTIAGFGARVAYGAPDADKPTGAQQVLTPSLWSVAGTYEAGPLYASLAYERHNDFQPINTLLGATATNGNDDAIKAGVSYRIGALQLALAYEQLRYRAEDITSALATTLLGAGTRSIEYELRNWFIAASYSIGAHVFALAYSQKSDDDLNGASFSGTGTRQFSARWGANLSKRTQLYAVATRISNEANAYQAFGVNPLGATVPLGLSTSRGADPTGFGVGIIHRF